MTDPTRAPEASPQQIEEYWERFKASGDERAREGLIIHYSPLVKFVA